MLLGGRVGRMELGCMVQAGAIPHETVARSL